MNNPPDHVSESPAEMVQRLANHLSVIARRLTESQDILRRLEPLIRAALWVWIVFPIVLMILLLYFAMQIASQ
jgi:hypothetical protein